MFKSGRSMRIRFDDFHLAFTAASIASKNEWPCTVKFCSPQEYAATKLNDYDSADPYEGQVMMNFQVRDVRVTNKVLDMTEQAVHGFAQQFAHVHAMLCVAREEYDNIVSFRVEFDSVEAAKICVSFWNRLNSSVDMEYVISIAEQTFEQC